jgi:hypothetical protein
MKPKLLVLLASLAALAAWIGQLGASRSWPDGL